MKTLYITDLDGTLLNSNQEVSEFTKETINGLIDKGMMFSYATARSYSTAGTITKDLNIKHPVILYNGAMVMDTNDQSIVIKNFFDDSVHSLLDDLMDSDIYPIVYSYRENREKMLFIPEKATYGMQLFIDSREGDGRRNPIVDKNLYHQGEVFCITCIDSMEKLRLFYEKYKDKYHCVLRPDIYSGEPWLDIVSKSASKSNAIKQLKELLNCDKVVVFGDGKNDIDMFNSADMAYAMENAVPELKNAATSLIQSNNDHGVAKWLKDNYK